VNFLLILSLWVTPNTFVSGIAEKYHAFFMQTTEPLHIGNLIMQKLNEQERSMAWLAGKVGYSRATMLRMLRKHSMDSEALYQISVVLGMDFHAMYSQKMKSIADVAET